MQRHNTTEVPSADPEQTGLRNGHGLSTARVEALTDGVFAIVMTLLVFNIHIPRVLQPALAQGSLWALWQAFFIGNGQGAILIAYVMTFVLLGVYWVSHHVQFQYIHCTDRYLLWINVAFLLTISFLPFTTELVGNYWSSSNQLFSQAVIIVYGVHLLLISVNIYCHWWYGTYKHRLIKKAVSPHLILAASRRILVAPIFCLIAILVSYISPKWSIICYLLIPLFYIFPGHIDQHWGLVQVHQHDTQHPQEKN